MTINAHTHASEIVCGRNATECEDMRMELQAARRTIEGMAQDARDHGMQMEKLKAELAEWRTGKRAITPPEVAKLSARAASAEHRASEMEATARSLNTAISSHLERWPECKDRF